MSAVLEDHQQLALDTILHKTTKGIPTFTLFLMEHAHLERLAGVQPGDYVKSPEKVYHAAQIAGGVCLTDQYIPRNPLSMGHAGYDTEVRTATTGSHEIVCDGMKISSPEDVVEHMEKFIFPKLERDIKLFNEDARVQEILKSEAVVQAQLGPTILKTGYEAIKFPTLAYFRYGYENYFMAFALFPEIIERHFSLQADYALLNNQAAARAYAEGQLPPLFRLDHDMADSRSTLVNIATLDKIWFPHFARCLAPILKTNVKLIWHCDGNLMNMVPRLLEVGIQGFQGFQYEDGMDYARICRMKSKHGNDLFIIGGVSATTTLPLGTPEDVKKQMRWLVENGPKTGLVLGPSSSITPGATWENIKTFVDGLGFYREHGRSGTFA